MRRRLFKYHPIIGYTKMPDRQVRAHFADGTFRYRTNSAGFRDNGEFVLAKDSDKKRVLVFGDSFTEGACVNDGERFTDVLQNSLGAEFYNFALSGTGTDQQYLTHREIGVHYEHDLVVVGVWIENIRRNVAASRVQSDRDGRHVLTAKPYFTLDDAQQLELHNQPVPRPTPLIDDSPQAEGVDTGTLGRAGLKGLVAEGITRLGPGPKRLAQRVSRWQPYPEYDDPEGDAWKLTRRILENWANESSVPLLVMPIPVYQYVEKTAPSDAMRSRFAELGAHPGLRVHDPLPDLWKYSTQQRRAFRFAHDHHFTPAGHAALARSLEPVISEMLAS